MVVRMHVIGPISFPFGRHFDCTILGSYCHLVQKLSLLFGLRIVIVIRNKNSFFFFEQE